MLSVAGAYAQEPPQTVSTIVASYSDWQDSIDAVGSLRAVRGADLAAEMPGIVDWIGFDSGQDVKQGDVLLRLKPNDDPGKLAELQAAADLAAANLSRDTKQFRAEAVSQATLDADQSTLRAARARVVEQQALMDEKIVRAPFAGKLGLRQVDIGQFLPAGTAIVTLQALDPIYVDFYVPQQAAPRLAAGDTVALTVDAFPGRGFVAKITATSPKVDSGSRMAQVRATVANADHALLPGMFASVHAKDGPVHRYVTLPNAAVVYNPYGSTVYVVSLDKSGKAGTVHQAVIQTGASRGDQVSVLAGLHEGDMVVTAGQIKLHQGSAIVINNSVQPSDDAHPNPPEE